MKNKIIIETVAITLILAVCIGLVANKVLHPLVLAILILIGVPWLKGLYIDLMRLTSNNVRKLKKHLPKIGYAIESITPHPQNNNVVRFVGKFKEETIIFDTSSTNAYVTIWDPNWLQVSTYDPNMPKFMEAINATNSQCGPTVVFSSPDNEGNRTIHTVCSTILPNQNVSDFLNSTLIQVLNKKAELQDNFRDYPWLIGSRKNPIGFNASQQMPKKEEGNDNADTLKENTHKN